MKMEPFDVLRVFLVWYDKHWAEMQAHLAEGLPLSAGASAANVARAALELYPELRVKR